MTVRFRTRLTLGAPPVQKRGEMLHSFVRYFDLESKEPGLPEDVAALVTRIADKRVELELVNTSLFDERRVVVQAGAYGEHRFGLVDLNGAKAEVNGSAVVVEMAPGAGAL